MRLDEDGNVILQKHPREGVCAAKFCTRPAREGRKLCWHCTEAQRIARDPARHAYNQIKHHAKERRIEFTLTLEEFRALAATVPDFFRKDGKRSGKYHIDRIEGHGPYSANNIKITTPYFNISKGNRERHELVHKENMQERWDDLSDDEQTYIDELLS